MNIHFSNISFKQNIKNKQDNKTNKKIQPHVAESRIFKHNEKISEETPINPKFEIIRRASGAVIPSSYDDCVEKMSFENDNNVDIWRDSYYEPEYSQTYHFDNRDELTSHFIKERKYSYQNYSYDDVPLSDSLLRKDYGFIGTPLSGIDTDMPDVEVHKIKFLNFREELVPSSIKKEYFSSSPTKGATISDFASLANMLYEDGYSTNEIIRGMERCVIKASENFIYAEPELFKFLVKHPNLKNEVVRKHNTQECFDKNFANYFGILKEHYFDNEKDIREALNLCRTKKSAFSLVNNDLCEIVGLLRHKTAQGIPFENNQNNSTDYRAKRQSKYCDRKQPLTQKDIELIKKIKSDGETFQIKLDIVKNQLRNEKQTVDYVLTNLDNLVEEVIEAEKIKLQETEEKEIRTENKTTTEKLIEVPKNSEVETKAEVETKPPIKPEIETKPSIKIKKTVNNLKPKNNFKPKSIISHNSLVITPNGKIHQIVFDEVEVLGKKTATSNDKNFQTGVTNRLKFENVKHSEITNVLENLSKLGQTININDQTISKYLDIISLKSEDGKTSINNKFNALVTRIWSSSRNLGETEIKLFEKIKNAPETEINLLVKTIEKMLEYDIPNNKIIENIDEAFKYSKRMDNATNKLTNPSNYRYGLSTSLETTTKILDALNVELKFLLKKDNFSCSKSLILPIVEDIVAGKVDFFEALKKISLAKWKLF